MNIETHIEKPLWLAIRSTYQAGNYSYAILDAIHYLSNILREKAGIDGDGAALVGQALGGESPRLRINRLQTEAERNEQRGMENILRGMYQAIRNPRSHEQIEDVQETADAVIYFIDYLLGIIQKSEEPFVMSKFMDRFFDPEFVKSQHYAELLVNEIPSNKRFDTLIGIYRDKLKGEIYHIGLVVQALISKLSEDQIKQFLAIISDELNIIRDEKDFRYNMHLMPANLWEQLSEVSRMRAENRVIKDLREGEVIGQWPQILCKYGALATWARKHFQFFKLKDVVAKVLIEKLESKKESSVCYVTNYFLGQLSEIVVASSNIERCINAISNHIRENNKSVRNSFIGNFGLLPERWQNDFGESLKDLTDKDNPALYLNDGSPFLSLLPEEGDDEVPF